MCDTSPPVQSHSPNGVPHILVLSDDSLLRELVAELLSNERLSVAEAGDLDDAAARCAERMPTVLLLDSMVGGELALRVLTDPASLFGEEQPSMVVLAGSGTPAEVKDHELVDAVLPQPLTSEVLVGVVRRYATFPSRHSGTRMRPDVALQIASSLDRDGEAK